MKNVFFILWITLSSVASAQTTVAASATNIAPLLIGETIPNITLKTSENKDVKISDLFGKKKTVLIFYRGGWCPYCNLHLQAMAEAENQILDLGYQIIAVSPDAPEKIKITQGKEEIKYTLLSDSNGELIKAMGIAFKAPGNYKSVINVHSKGINKGFLPVPSVFVLNTESDILFEYVSPDFKRRITSELLVAVLKNLK